MERRNAIPFTAHRARRAGLIVLGALRHPRRMWIGVKHHGRQTAAAGFALALVLVGAWLAVGGEPGGPVTGGSALASPDTGWWPGAGYHQRVGEGTSADPTGSSSATASAPSDPTRTGTTTHGTSGGASRTAGHGATTTIGGTGTGGHGTTPGSGPTTGTGSGTGHFPTPPRRFPSNPPTPTPSPTPTPTTPASPHPTPSASVTAKAGPVDVDATVDTAGGSVTSLHVTACTVGLTKITARASVHFSNGYDASGASVLGLTLGLLTHPHGLSVVVDGRTFVVPATAAVSVGLCS